MTETLVLGKNENEISEEKIENFGKWLSKNQPKDVWEDKIDQLIELYGKYLGNNDNSKTKEEIKLITEKMDLFNEKLKKDQKLFRVFNIDTAGGCESMNIH